ncbi:MAG TPA: YkgJ family cysteine cluster protein [Gemmatimonadales bacterium]|nr:YkgJ family cysteine cluster protein [Gemmatimonadales bacterium]
MQSPVEQYQQLLERLDRWFHDVSERRPGVIPCRAGCTACCHGPFDISLADVRLLEEGLTRLAPQVRDQVRARSRALLERMRALAPEWSAPYDVRDLDEERFDRMTEALAEVPCPLLDDAGACQVYAHRPMVCRLIGLPMMTAEGELLENACPIQEEFPVYASLDPQLFDLGSLNDAEAEVLDRMGEDPGFETVIAAVVSAH